MKIQVCSFNKAKDILNTTPPSKKLIWWCNSIDHAQEVFSSVGKKLRKNITLLHSRFKIEDYKQIYKSALDYNFLIITSVGECFDLSYADIIICELTSVSRILSRFKYASKFTSIWVYWQSNQFPAECTLQEIDLSKSFISAFTPLKEFSYSKFQDYATALRAYKTLSVNEAKDFYGKPCYSILDSDINLCFDTNYFKKCIPIYNHNGLKQCEKLLEEYFILPSEHYEYLPSVGLRFKKTSCI